MGIKTDLTLETINQICKDVITFESIHESRDGISDTTYILKDKNASKYICKLYESASIKEVQEERRLLEYLHPFIKVPKPLFELYSYDDKPMVFYSYIHGDSIDASTHDNIDAIIDEIGTFLADFHTLSRDFNSTKKANFSHKILKKMLKNSPEKFRKRYKKVENISLGYDGIIHGDLFPDNAKFIGNKLNGVYDFIEACKGSFIFDLAVVANSWCFDNVDKLLNSYNKNSPKKITKSELHEMMKFAALFYALQRYHGDGERDYREYLEKFDALDQISTPSQNSS